MYTIKEAETRGGLTPTVARAVSIVAAADRAMALLGT